MIYTHEYYLLTRHENTIPAWVKSERYFNCDNFVKIFSFFRNKA